MPRLLSHPCFLLLSLSAIWFFGCSNFGSEIKNDGTAPAVTPDCQGNQTTEGGLISNPTYKTWVKYEKVDSKKGFDLALNILQSHGH